MLRLALGGNGKERRRSRKENSETNLRYLTAVFASSARVGVELEVFIFCFVLFDFLEQMVVCMFQVEINRKERKEFSRDRRSQDLMKISRVEGAWFGQPNDVEPSEDPLPRYLPSSWKYSGLRLGCLKAIVDC